jgi:hypothetical protein
MASAQALEQPHVPAWKRLGLKLKNSQPTNEEAVSPVVNQLSSSASESKKRKATEIDGGSPASQDQAAAAASRSENARPETQTNGRPLKRKKSVAFADGTKNEDGDSNEKLLEDYVAQQEGGEGQFSKSEVAQFTAPQKVHPANEPSTKINGVANEGKKEKKKKERTQKSASDGSLKQDPAYVTYLKEYRSARSSWKFNKSHQIKLLNNLYNTYWLPLELDDTISSYLSGLQGEAVRKRVEETAEKVIKDTDGLESADEIMPGRTNLNQAREKALKAQLKQTKSNLRNQEAAEHAYSDEHQEKLRKRKRAALVLQSLRAQSAPTSEELLAVAVQTSDGVNGVPAKRKKTRRSKKMRTGMPDDDDTDETSSVSSVPSTAASASEDEDNGSDESSEVSSEEEESDSSDGSSDTSESEDEDK